MEYDESRPYQPGDDIRSIDWRVTARTGDTHTKLFREERERPVFINVDLRAPMFFATQGGFKSVIAAEIAALLAWTAHHQGDRIGGEIFSEQLHKELKPRRGQRNLLHFLKALNQITQPGRLESDSLLHPLQRLNRMVHPGSLVCLISDFRGLDDAAASQLGEVARHSELLLFHVYDRLEAKLPSSGHYRLGFGQRTMEIDAGDSQLQSRYTGQFTSRLQMLDKLSRRFRCRLITCRSDESPVNVLRDAIGNRTTRLRRAV